MTAGRSRTAPSPSRTPLPHSQALNLKIRLTGQVLSTSLAGLWHDDGDLLPRYARYLAAMHQVIRASVPLMELAGARCAERGGADALSTPLAAYFARHITEEQDHDQWLLEDLSVLHGSRGPVPAPWAGAAAARLVGAQYYWIEHCHPVSLLGYMAVLEGRAPAAGLADRLAALTGLPASAFRTVRAHATLDPGHAGELDALLDSLPLSGAETAAVGASALHTIGALTDLITEISAPRPGGNRG
ncbi:MULTISPECIES: iron-containing redox enzyme family protein [unclassified Streptomyces]|uniref:iron-containing redox enzyme family protein n=1 Tax=unclassified Streptomyces TaxID=2593676 RepID=UPI0035DCDC2C